MLLPKKEARKRTLYTLVQKLILIRLACVYICNDLLIKYSFIFSKKKKKGEIK